MSGTIVSVLLIDDGTSTVLLSAHSKESEAQGALYGFVNAKWSEYRQKDRLGSYTIASGIQTFFDKKLTKQPFSYAMRSVKMGFVS